MTRLERVARILGLACSLAMALMLYIIAWRALLNYHWCLGQPCVR